MSESSPYVNALVGAAATVVLSFVPFSPIMGGALAGYLQAGDEREGAKVGAIAGVFATIPLLLFLFLIFGIFSFLAISPNGSGGLLFLAFLVAVIVSVVALYAVGLSAIGGVVGATLADRGDHDQPGTRETPVEVPTEATEERAD